MAITKKATAAHCILIERKREKLQSAVEKQTNTENGTKKSCRSARRCCFFVTMRQIPARQMSSPRQMKVDPKIFNTPVQTAKSVGQTEFEWYPANSCGNGFLNHAFQEMTDT